MQLPIFLLFITDIYSLADSPSQQIHLKDVFAVSSTFLLTIKPVGFNLNHITHIL